MSTSRYRALRVLSVSVTIAVTVGIGAAAGHPRQVAFAQAEILDQRVEAEEHAAGPGSPRLGQTFTAGVTGTLIRLEIEVRSNGSTGGQRVEILGVDAQGLPTGSVLGTGVIPAGATAWVNVSLSPSPSVSSGNRYAFALPEDSGIAVAAGIEDPYAGGAAVFAVGTRWSSPMPGADLHFRSYVLDPTATPPGM